MNNRKILIVDDEQQIRDLFEQFFSSAGYEVQTAQTAERALDIMRETPHWVLFLDLNLPSMNGVDLCRQLHKEYPMAIIMAVTGYASMFDLINCRDAGFEDYFIKPAKLSDLLKAAEHAFKKLERWKKI